MADRCDTHAEIAAIIRDPAFEKFLDTYWLRRHEYFQQVDRIRHELKTMYGNTLSYPRDDPDMVFVASGARSAISAAINALDAYYEFIADTENNSKHEMAQWYIREKLTEKGHDIPDVRYDKFCDGTERVTCPFCVDFKY